MCCGNEPETAAPPRIAPDPLVRSLLDHSKELGLEGHRQIPDLIEKESATVGGSKGAVTRINSTCEGPALMAEEFAARQFGNDGRAVDYDEITLADIEIEFVNDATKQFLSSAALTTEENGCRREARDLDDLAQDSAPGAAGTDQVVRDCVRLHEGIDGPPTLEACPHPFGELRG
jgi:hypothetical protein